MALPWRRCYSIERLLRGVQISSSRPPCVSLSLLLSPSVSLFLSSLVSHTSSLSLALSYPLLFHSPFSLSPRHPTSVSSWSSSSSSSISSSSSSFSSPTSLSFLFPRSLLSLPSLCLSFRVPCCSPRPSHHPSVLLSLSLIPLSLSFSLAPASFSRLLVTRRRPPSTFSS